MCNFTVTIDDESEGTGEFLYAAGQPSSFYGFDTKWILGYSETLKVWLQRFYLNEENS